MYTFTSINTNLLYAEAKQVSNNAGLNNDTHSKNKTSSTLIKQQKAKYASRFSSETCSFISRYFWFSMFATSSTPIYRMLNKHWRGSSVIYALAKQLLSTSAFHTLVQYGLIAPGTNYAAEGEVIAGMDGVRMEGIDWAFGLHAALGMLWMTAGYIQICHAHKLHHKMHKYFGYFSSFCFLLHTLAAFNIVYVDAVRHTALPKIFLLAGMISPLVQVASGVAVALRKQKGWAKTHEDLMALAYISSLSGSGTIRIIAHLQHWTKTGPIPFQNLHGGMATFCQAVYTNRLMLVALLSSFWACMYVRTRKDSSLIESHRKSFIVLLSQTIAMFALSYVPGWEEAIPAIFGAPRTMQNKFAVTVAVAAIMWQGWNEFKSAVYAEVAKVKNA